MNFRIITCYFKNDCIGLIKNSRMAISKIKSRLQHNPPSSIPQVMKELPEGMLPTNKCKLYILLKNTPNNNKEVEILHGVQLKNINKVLSKRTAHNQKSAFFTSFDKSTGRTRTVRLFA